MNLKTIDENYLDALNSIKQKVKSAQIQAALAVNAEMVILYWEIGQVILDRQKEAGWGAKIIDRLASDLLSSFPDLKGFSSRNLKYMRKFAETYPDFAIVQQVAAQMPWFHNCVLLEKVKNPIEREWYIHQTFQQGWSRNILVHQIESGLFHRQGKAITNFDRTLPKPQSELAEQLLKEPYCFDFISLEEKTTESNLEKALINHFKDFLLELGVGFAFVGNQYHL